MWSNKVKRLNHATMHRIIFQFQSWRQNQRWHLSYFRSTQACYANQKTQNHARVNVLALQSLPKWVSVAMLNWHMSEPIRVLPIYYWWRVTCRCQADRIAQKSVIIPPHSSIELPVNCVERSRWTSGMQGSFSKSDFALPPSARERKSSLLKNRMNAHIQASSGHLSMKSQQTWHILLNSDLEKFCIPAPKLQKLDVTEPKLSTVMARSWCRASFVELFYDQTVCKLHQVPQKSLAIDAFTNRWV